MIERKELVPVVVQDVKNNNVLMLAYMNDEALELTKKTGYMHYWSRSRNAIWKKGETSGNIQKCVELMTDCDGDAILARVEQTGVACHTGTYSCFSKDPIRQQDIVAALWRVFDERKANPSDSSYTCRLFKNRNLLLKKIAEESSEVIIAAKDKSRKELIYESGDLMYHLMVLLYDEGISMDEIHAELEGRRK
ncbi:MAG: bifunctional phosphoribosyl-AMP cyclohydrolase/phosphoribosyl-ATP diphosphatase HisIE [Candidatus Thermoplasmatota archaeon]|nr:bifunctional phosphoribosyl-AMP cyclohydrolase/phosphoribosyl-ATP diphosphatase HisIE [Candidatus Thermoplasmatota archaeon]